MKTAFEGIMGKGKMPVCAMFFFSYHSKQKCNSQHYPFIFLLAIQVVYLKVAQVLIGYTIWCSQSEFRLLSNTSKSIEKSGEQD